MDDLIERIDKAHIEMCDAVNRQWNGKKAALNLSIPARENHDTDLIVCGALRAAKREILRLRGDDD